MDKLYTIIISQDDFAVHSIKERIMHRSSNVNILRILVDKEFSSKKKGTTFDMSDFTCILEYKTPISDKYTSEIITPSEELYRDKLEYLVPVTTKMTSEVGDLSIKFTFTKLEMLSDGTMVEHVRKIPATNIQILPVEQWSDYIADSDLDPIVQVMLTLQSKIEQEKAYAEIIHQTKADSIHIDSENSKLCLDSNGEHISSVDLTELSDAIMDSNEAGTVKVVI